MLAVMRKSPDYLRAHQTAVAATAAAATANGEAQHPIVAVADTIPSPSSAPTRKDLNIDKLNPYKRAVTRFQFVSYRPSDDTSLVVCQPFTGRTHQIRVHLLHLGHPIANDPKYFLPESTESPTHVHRPDIIRASSHTRHDTLSEQFRAALGRNFDPNCDQCQYFKSLIHAANGGTVDNNHSSALVHPRMSRAIWLHSWRYDFQFNNQYTTDDPASNKLSTLIGLTLPPPPSARVSDTGNGQTHPTPLIMRFEAPFPEWAQSDSK
jgi:hypothetical protein